MVCPKVCHRFEGYVSIASYCPLGYERVYLPLCKVADTPFHIQGDDMFYNCFSGIFEAISSIKIQKVLVKIFPATKIQKYMFQIVVHTEKV